MSFNIKVEIEISSQDPMLIRNVVNKIAEFVSVNGKIVKIGGSLFGIYNNIVIKLIIVEEKIEFTSHQIKPFRAIAILEGNDGNKIAEFLEEIVEMAKSLNCYIKMLYT